VGNTFGNTFGLRTWIEYGFHHAKDDLGWAEYRVSEYRVSEYRVSEYRVSEYRVSEYRVSEYRVSEYDAIERSLGTGHERLHLGESADC
jgi:hypothetical protein